MRSVCELPLALGLACQWEALAAKPGNVHRTADFEDTQLVDFLSSGAAVSAVAQHWVRESQQRWDRRCGLVGSPQLDQDSSAVNSPSGAACSPDFGRWVFEAIQATRKVTRSNTNLGICLLLAPLAEAYLLGHGVSGPAPNAAFQPPNDLTAWRQSAAQLVEGAGVGQTRWLYRAIALANPGGLGVTTDADVVMAADLVSPPKAESLADVGDMGLSDQDTVARVMGLAVERDRIAEEYSSGFEITFNVTVPSLAQCLDASYPLQWAIIGTFLRLLAAYPDTLIARKLGPVRAAEVSRWAGQLSEAFFPDSLLAWNQCVDRLPQIEEALGELDFALRSNENRLNPGTTADLIAAGLFVSLLAEKIQLPPNW